MFIIHLSEEPLLANRLLHAWHIRRYRGTLSKVQNVMKIGQRIFVWRVPENRMFEQESEVVHKTVVSAAALAHEKSCIPAIFQLS
jgi:hypothetical protein